VWLAGWAVRVLLLITAPIYYLSRFLAEAMNRLDAWSWTAIHAREMKKPPQSETSSKQPQANAKKTVV
jgi:hypothetical protein